MLYTAKGPVGLGVPAGARPVDVRLEKFTLIEPVARVPPGDTMDGWLRVQDGRWPFATMTIMFDCGVAGHLVESDGDTGDSLVGCWLPAGGPGYPVVS